MTNTHIKIKIKSNEMQMFIELLIHLIPALKAPKTIRQSINFMIPMF